MYFHHISPYHKPSPYGAWVLGEWMNASWCDARVNVRLGLLRWHRISIAIVYIKAGARVFRRPTGQRGDLCNKSVMLHSSHSRFTMFASVRPLECVSLRGAAEVLLCVHCCTVDVVVTVSYRDNAGVLVVFLDPSLLWWWLSRMCVQMFVLSLPRSQ